MSNHKSEPRGPYTAVLGNPSTFAIEADITTHAEHCMYLGAIYLWISGTRFGTYESETARWLNPIVGMLAELRVATPLQIEHTVMSITPHAALSRIYAALYGHHESEEHLAEDHAFISACAFSPGEAFDSCFIAFPSDGQSVRALACVMSRGDTCLPTDIHEALIEVRALNTILDDLLDSIPRLPGFIDPRTR